MNDARSAVDQTNIVRPFSGRLNASLSFFRHLVMLENNYMSTASQYNI